MRAYYETSVGDRDKERQLLLESIKIQHEHLYKQLSTLFVNTDNPSTQAILELLAYREKPQSVIERMLALRKYRQDVGKTTAHDYTYIPDVIPDSSGSNLTGYSALYTTLYQKAVVLSTNIQSVTGCHITINTTEGHYSVDDFTPNSPGDFKFSAKHAVWNKVRKKEPLEDGDEKRTVANHLQKTLDRSHWKFALAVLADDNKTKNKEEIDKILDLLQHFVERKPNTIVGSDAAFETYFKSATFAGALDVVAHIVFSNPDYWLKDTVPHSTALSVLKLLHQRHPREDKCKLWTSTTTNLKAQGVLVFLACFRPSLLQFFFPSITPDNSYLPSHTHTHDDRTVQKQAVLRWSSYFSSLLGQKSTRNVPT